VAARSQEPWRHARQEREKELLKQWLVDRQAGRPIRLAPGTEPVPSAGLSRYELEEAAREYATEICRRAQRKSEGPKAVLRKKAKRGEAA
jgi:hypothetical protein